MDGLAEFKSNTIFSFYDDGFSEGVGCVYLSAAEVVAFGVTWGDLTYSGILAGIPTITWTDGAPAISPINPVSWVDSGSISGTRDVLTTRIRYLALNELASSWSPNELAELIGGETKLTGIGEAYFTSFIPELRSQCPDLFTAVMYTTELPERGTGVARVATREDSLIGTRFDMTDIGNALGVPRIVVSTIVWLILSAVVLFIILSRFGAHSRKFRMIGIPLITAFTFCGITCVLCYLLIAFVELLS